MKIEDTSIPDIKIIYPGKFTDARGIFIKTFNKELFKKNKMETHFEESLLSISKKNVIRGMHFQIPPHATAKLVYVVSGKIIDVVLDLRKESPCFGQYFSIELPGEASALLYVPIGFAHGFLSLEDNTVVSYLQSSCHNKDSDKGIYYNSFGFDWGVENPILSDRDKTLEPFKHFNSPF